MKEIKLKLVYLIFLIFVFLEISFFVFLIYKINFFLNNISETPSQGGFEGYDFKKYEILIKEFN